MNDKSLFEDQQIKDRVSKVWESVFTSSNRVLDHAKKYGFMGMESAPNPNIHMMLINLQMFDALINIILTNAEVFDVDYEDTKLLINSKQQIIRMDRVAAALQANNLNDFNEAMIELERQAVF